MNILLVYGSLIVLIIMDFLETRKFLTEGFYDLSHDRSESYQSSPRWIVRTGFVRSTFLIMDFVALMTLEVYPEILAVIAGLRMTEILPYIDHLWNLDRSKEWKLMELIFVPVVNGISSIIFLSSLTKFLGR